MSIKFKVTNTWKTVTQPWVKVNGVQTKATKVFYKEADVWREAWPLQPGPVGGLVTTTLYRNDRIEIDVDWTEPTTGETTAKYIVTVKIADTATSAALYTTTVTVNAPTTALTLTNSNNGFHTFASKKAFTSVIAQSAAGRNSDTVTGLPVTIAQLPAPAKPLTYTLDINSCKPTHAWTHSGGRTITGVEISAQFGSGTATTATYNATTFTGTHSSWNAATIGAGTVTCKCRTTGPGGQSAWLTVTGRMPGPITLGTSTWLGRNGPNDTSTNADYRAADFRFGDGYLRVGVNGVDPNVQVFTIPYPGDTAWTHAATFNAGVYEVYAPASVNWGRNWTPYTMLLRPYNSANTWTGRDQYMGIWARKMPNPVKFHATDSATLRNGAWRSETTQDWQGSTSSGTNTAYFFYGTQVFDWLRIAHIGYYIDVSQAQVLIWRENEGGLVAGVQPRIMVHKASAYNVGDLGFGGGHDSTAIARGGVAWCIFPWEWAWYMSLKHDGYQGIGLHYPPSALTVSGNVSASYMIIKAAGVAFDANYNTDTMLIYHRN